MIKKMIVANWKANPESLREAKQIVNPLRRIVGKLKNVETVICPPAVFLSDLSSKTMDSLHFGAQDAFWELAGAYTGRLGPTMLRNTGADFLILGHSESRLLGDTLEIVNAKVRLAFRHGLRVILCVGERERDERGEYLKIIRDQIETALRDVPRKELKNLILAYEPVWAIGAAAKGADTPSAFFEQSIFLRKVLAGIMGKEAAMACPILYGGSANAGNAEGFLGEGGASGLLVGRASLDPKQFIEILKIANELK